MQKPAVKKHIHGACEEALRDLLLAAAAPDNPDAFLRRITAALCGHNALGPGGAAAVILRHAKDQSAFAAAVNFTAAEQRKLLTLLGGARKLPPDILHASLHGGGSAGWLLARITPPAQRVCAGQLLSLAAQTISGRLAQESREKLLTRERDIADAITHIEELYLSFPAVSLEEIARTVLDEARRLTGSRLGFAGYIDPATGSLQVPTVTDGFRKNSLAKKADIVPGEFTGLWGWVLKNKKPLLTNCAAEDRRAAGTPRSGVKIERFVSAPALSEKKLIGIIALANPRADYRPDALDAVKKLARVYALMLRNKLAEQQKQADEEKHRSILDTSSDLILTLSAEGAVTYVSRAIRNYGYQPEEVVGQHFSRFVHPDDRNRIKEIFSAALKAGHTINMGPYKLLKKNGAFAVVEQKSAVLPGRGSGQLLTGVIRDLTDSQRTAQQLAESELKYKTIFNKANVAIMIADAATGLLLDVNKDAEKLTGRSRKELIGMHQLKLHPSEASERYRKQFSDHSETDAATLTDVEVVRKDGTRAQVQLSASRLNLGDREVMLGIFHDISPRRQAERLLHDIVDKNPMSIQIVDRDGFTLSVNAAHTRLFGAVPPARFSIFRDWQLKEQGMKNFIERLKQGQIVHFPDSHYNAHDLDPRFPDHQVWVRTMAFPLKDGLGRPEKFAIMHEDITVSKLAETRLRDSEEKYKALVETTNTGFLILDESGKVIDANAEYLRLTGRAGLKEILGRSVTEWTAPYDLERNRREVKKCIKLGHVRDLCVDYIDQAGRITPIDISATVVRTGGSFRIVCLCRDITERRQAEARLGESEERYRLLFDNMVNPAFIQSPDGRILAVNLAACKVYGYTKAEFSAMTAADIELPLEATNLARRVAQLLLTKHIRFETRHRLKSGAIITVSAASQAVAWEGKTATLTTCRDITAQKQIETALRDSEERYRRLVEDLGREYFFYRHDTKGVFDYLSPTMTDMLGYTREEFLAHYTKHLTRNPLNKNVVKHTELSIRGIQQPPYEVELYHKDGSVRLLEVTETPLRGPDGKVIGVDGLAHDISERKRLESVMTESENKYRSLFETSRDALMVISPPRWEFSQANKTTLKLFGVDKEADFLKQTPWSISPKKQPDGRGSAEKAREMLTIALKNGSNYFEWEHRRLDGTVFAAEVLLTRVTIGEKQVIQACVRDINARKRTEAALQESERFLSSVVGNIPNMVFVKDAKELKFVRVNKAGEELLGISDSELLGTSDYDNFPRADADFFIRMDREVLAGKKLVDIPEEHIHTASGADKVLHTKKLPILGEDGEPLYLLGISEDITERKRLEKLLMENEETLRLIFETATDAIFLKDNNGKYLKANKACTDLFFVKPGDLPGKYDSDIFSPETAAKNRADDDEVIKQGKTLYFNRERISPAGKAYLSVAKTPLRGPGGKITGVLGVARDITEIKRMETELAVAKASEAMSKVARPIAHDFNNALAAIGGYASMIDDELAGTNPIKAEIAQIIKAVTRAAELTSKLQDFARNPKLGEQESGKDR
ncbi:MAG TPA: PAS domain S-box protein [Elusimicrobiales bacterium]|nr:PAS domain S-box protein [Elusimicrobiales bacterium]